MYARAFFASASRAAAHVDLNLTIPDSPCPVAFEDDINESPAPCPGLSVSAPPLPQEVLTPASPLSSDQEVFRRGLSSTPQSSFTSSGDTGSVRTYEATFRVIATKVTMKLGSRVLPTSSASQFVSFFGSVIL